MIELTPRWRRRHKNRHDHERIEREWQEKYGYGRLNKREEPAPTGDVYLIICKPTAQAYVGQTRNAKQRFSAHKGELRRGDHSSTLLQQAWDEHGEDAFLFTVVERRIDALFLHAREQFWMWRFEGRLLNASETAHPDRSHGVRQQMLKTFTDEELIAELKRRNTAVMVVS
ncbi:hypothetical protein [Pseudomonas phage Itty13]|uniref:GIY-YIG domain-containing protein n=1 Tax=Pseudomonas phage Itty13 TaxID=2805750 RepID=A0A889IQZ7_9CAUD|nr:homing endonuclease [Pseudomonas phage Itty13]QRE00605.1 hypothetical protein [Pseudomonas phage Itty13]